MFLGTYQAKLPQNRRVFIPSPFRQLLGENLILARWYEKCLVLVPFEAWKALYKRLVGNQKMIITPVRDTERFILGSAFGIAPDEQGRVIIPDALSLYANLGEEISFVGLGDRVEIWNKQIWDEKQALLLNEASGLIDKLAKQK